MLAVVSLATAASPVAAQTEESTGPMVATLPAVVSLSAVRTEDAPVTPVPVPAGTASGEILVVVAADWVPVTPPGQTVASPLVAQAEDAPVAPAAALTSTYSTTATAGGAPLSTTSTSAACAPSTSPPTAVRGDVWYHWNHFVVHARFRTTVFPLGGRGEHPLVILGRGGKMEEDLGLWTLDAPAPTWVVVVPPWRLVRGGST